MPDDAGVDIDFDRELASIQGTAAGVVPGTAVDVANGNGNGHDDGFQRVEFMGRQFRVADRIGVMPLLKFSAFANVGVNDPRALGAMYAMLRDCIYTGHAGCGECEDCKNGSEMACKDYDRGDWDTFEDHAMTTKAEAEDIFDLINKVMEVIAGRPTKPSGPSSAGPRRTSGGSTAKSSSRRVKGSRR